MGVTSAYLMANSRSKRHCSLNRLVCASVRSKNDRWSFGWVLGTKGLFGLKTSAGTHSSKESFYVALVFRNVREEKDFWGKYYGL